MILHAKIIGTGTPFVILHGFLGMGDNWKTLGNKFSQEGYQVHLVDQRNHGRSFHSDTFNYDVMADDLKRYCEHYGLEKIVLLGHSMGGKTAMQFATQYPEQVSKLIIADIGPQAYPPHHQYIIKALKELAKNPITSRQEADATLSQYIKEPSIRQFLLKNLYWKEKGKLGLRLNLPALSKNILEIGKPLKEDAVFTGDTLFLKGEKSNYILPQDLPLIKKHFPKAEIKTIKNAGHWLHAENPTQFFNEVLAFLEGI